MERISKALQIGKTGEFFTCFDLTRKGLVAMLSDQGLPYDVLIDIGNKLLRVQVKARQSPLLIKENGQYYNRGYQFTTMHREKGTRHPYSQNEVDVFALVALDIMQVAYVTRDEVAWVTNIRDDNLKGKYSNEIAYKRAVDMRDRIKELSTTMSIKQMIKETGLTRVQLERYLYKPRQPSLIRSKYFSELTRDKNWFLNL